MEISPERKMMLDELGAMTQQLAEWIDLIATTLLTVGDGVLTNGRMTQLEQMRDWAMDVQRGREQ